MASGTTFGNLRVTVQADTSKFSKGIKRAQKDLTLFQKTTRALSSNMAKLLGGLGTGLAAGALAKGFMDTAAAIDETAKAARNLGLATEELSGLRHAAELSGLSMSSLESGLKRLTRNLNDADRGLDSAKENFTALGLQASELIKLGLSDQMQVIATQLSKVTNETEKAAIRMELFGRAGSDMGVLMEQGGDGIAKMINEAKDLGLVFTAEEASNLEQFNDEMTRLKAVMGGTWRRFVIDVAPEARDAIIALKETVEGFQLLGRTIQQNLPSDMSRVQTGRDMIMSTTGLGLLNQLSDAISTRVFGNVAQGRESINEQDRQDMEATRERNKATDAVIENTRSNDRTNQLLERWGLERGQGVVDPFATATIMK